ncbi:MAG: transposase [Crenarchaeota archaeon]|nr:transposase [Thermoproteota archaeon]MDW8033470.1 hypothetical protein [Nitrososphaerota archaeon]
MRLILSIVLLTFLVLSPILLMDSIIPSSSIQCNVGNIPVSGLKNSPWVYALGLSVSGYSMEMVATEGKELVSYFLQFFNSSNWFILVLVVIIATSIVASFVSSSVSDAIKASVFSITMVSVVGLYYMNSSLKPSLYNLPFRQPVIEDAFATLSLMVVVGTIFNLVAVSVLSGVLTYVILTFKPRSTPVSPVKTQSLEKTIESKAEKAGILKAEEKAPPLSTAPLCPKCGSKLVWKPNESRYYCNKCGTYPEEVYFKI